MHAHLPMFGFLLLAFLMLAVVLAVAVFFAFKSGRAGQTRLSGAAGCLVALALLAIATVGGLALLFVGIVTLSKAAVQHGPVKKLDLEWPRDEGRDASPAPPAAADHGPRLTLELRGLDDPSSVMQWLRRRTDADTSIAVHGGKDEKGATVTIVELTLPPDHEVARELRDLRKDLEESVPDLRLPTGVQIEFRGPDDD